MGKNITIKEDFTLPSEGKIYNKLFDSVITLRSMTVEDEMKRLSPSINPYKNMSEIIESCITSTKLPISVYDLCIGDYTYLLHKLRIVTYGADYPIKYVCPNCGSIETTSINLDEMKINKYNPDINEKFEVNLPVTGHKIKLKFQTPRDLDKISNEAQKMKEEFPEMQGDPMQLLTLQSLIAEVDDQPVDPIFIKETLKKLPMKDANMIARAATSLNNSIGVDTNLKLKCKHCGEKIETPFRYTSEFFGPSN